MRAAAVRLQRVPTRAEVVSALKENVGVVIDAKTVSRRCPDERKREIAEGTLGQNRDKINVPGDIGDKIDVPEGQNLSLPFEF